MIARSWLSRCWQWQIGGCVAIFGALSVGVGDRLLAQIVPDNTLGAEGSVVTPNVNIRGIPSDRIDGGATRGANLFHSFSDFNVGQGRGVYFANPAGIENILTRVTGNNPSNILGRLGVLGGANLFLLNPNGIVFGQNASLDIQGSFLATTATRIQLGDSGYFSATQPQTSRLLSVSPGALFFNAVANQPTSIINRGNLATGKHLTLSAGNLDLQGQLEAGGDLTLQARDTVKVRDTVTTPFLARSGGNLTIVGSGGIDILALNHPTQTPFVSGGNLSLISDGVISGDAHFSSGGSFSIRSVSGGLANMVSKHDPIISSNGDVDVVANYTGASLLVESQGNIRFRGDINITAPDTSGLPAAPDTATLSTSTALILRSGQSALAYGAVNSGVVPTTSNQPVPTGITLLGNVIVQPFNGAGGVVNLTAASGNVSTRLISTNGQQTSNFDNDANGGAISLTAANGSITTGDLLSCSHSFSGNAGAGGAIALTAANGSITTGDLDSYSSSNSGKAGQGGGITLTAANDINITGNLYSYSNSDSGNGNQGGAISLTAANGSITTGGLYSFSYSQSGNASQGGAIGLTAANDILLESDLYSYSYSLSGNAGQGGAISLIAKGGDIAGSGNQSTVLGSFSVSKQETPGNGGNVALEAKNKVTNLEILTLSSSSQSGTVQVTGLGNLLLTNTNILTSKQVTLPSQVYLFGEPLTLKVEGIGQSGNVDVTSTGNITFNNSSIQSDTKGSGNAGNITVSSPGRVTFNNSSITSKTSSTGAAGSITINARDIRLSNNSDITTTVNQGQGRGGDITLTADSIVAFDDSDILAFAPGGTGGNITLQTPAFFGENYRPAPKGTDPRTLDRNNRVDINATGAVNGVITLPDTTFIQNSLTELPSNQINTEQLLANSCIVRRNQPTRGSFFITGTGGLPQRPGDAQISSFPTVDIETLPSDSTPSTTNLNRPWQKGDPIVEPQGVYRLPNGKLVMSRECPQ